MGIVYEEIEIEGQPVKVKIDTGCDFPLALRREVIEQLKLHLSPLKAKTFREEEGKVREILENVWLARIKICGCEFAVPQNVIEASGENLLGHPILQALQAKVDEEKHKLVFDPDKCPKGSKGGITGIILY
jgi:predicted aspartyl protease